MNWLSVFITSWNLDNKFSFAGGVNNWTRPFIDNVIQKLNHSVAGPQRVFYENDDLYDDRSMIAEPTLILMPVFIVLFLKQVLKKDTNRLEKNLSFYWPQFLSPNVFFCVFSYVLFTLILPILLSLLIFSFLYRQIVKLVLKLKHKERFVKLLDGSDAIWAVEEDKAKSIINVIATIQVNSVSNEEFLDRLRRLIKNVILFQPKLYSKMLYRRSYDLGYFYWEKNSRIEIEDYVRPMKDLNRELSKDDLNSIVSEASNSNLPHNNTATWEILVGTNPIAATPGEYVNMRGKCYPLMFRIHHSLGDGVVLMKLLLKILADEERTNMRRQISIVIPIDDFKSSVKQLFGLSNLDKVKTGVAKLSVTMYKIISVLVKVPMSLVGQLLRPPDSNILHGNQLQGEKICAWVKESDSSPGVLRKIKCIKNRIQGATFSDLFLTALSASYYKYFTQNLSKNNSIPDIITSIVPVRVEQSDLNLKIKNPSLKIENRFTVAMLSIPINIGQKTTHLKRLVEVTKQTNELKYSADFYVNYFIMALAGHVFPEPILRPMLKSEQASLVVSNLPGPSNVTICGGHKIKDMAFFVPHRGTTGMGITLFSYNGQVNLGLMVDKALMNSVEDAEVILKGALEELETLDVVTSRLVCSQSSSFEMHT